MPTKEKNWTPLLTAETKEKEDNAQSQCHDKTDLFILSVRVIMVSLYSCTLVMFITQCGSTAYIGIAQVTWHQPLHLKILVFTFTMHFISHLKKLVLRIDKICCIWYEILAKMQYCSSS